MGKVTGFIEIERQERTYKSAGDRIRNFKEFVIPMEEGNIERQAARCMDCGVPFCHKGCPVNNQICTLNIDDAPVTIKTIECAIVDKAWENDWLPPQIPETKTGKKVAIIGAGPAGMAAAQQLARAGHDVHLYDKHEAVGGLLRIGIPDFKMEKHLIDRRVEQMKAEGVTLHCGINVGQDITIKDLTNSHDALLLSCGSEHPRDLSIKGRELDGVHFAMDFLSQQNRKVQGINQSDVEPISAASKQKTKVLHGRIGH